MIPRPPRSTRVRSSAASDVYKRQECSYAAYIDDFTHVTERQREGLIAGLGRREQFGQPYLCGERSLDDAALSFDLALLCYGARGVEPRRRAALLHRRSWIERARDDSGAELVIVAQALSADRRALHHDE